MSSSSIKQYTSYEEDFVIQTSDKNKKDGMKNILIEWSNIEKKYQDIHTIAVMNAMMNLGNENIELLNQHKNYKTCGDELYLEFIRPLLVKLDYVTKKNIPISKEIIKKNKNNKKKSFSVEEIKLINTKEKLKGMMEDLVLSFKTVNKRGYRYQIVEIRIATFIHESNILMSKESNLEDCYEMIIGIEKTLENLKGIQGISKIALEDLNSTVSKLKYHSEFNYKCMFENYPRLSLSTSYDKIFPNLSIKPYKSQIELIEAIKNNAKCLCLYNTMIGSGKTTINIALSKYVASIKKPIKKVSRKMKLNKVKTIMDNKKMSKKDVQVLFVCQVEPVRNQVARIAYNTQIPFGIAMIENDYLKIFNNQNCKNDEERVLIIADLDAAIEILKKDNNYILFLDEPTIGADKPDHPITDKISKILTLAPEKTILSSATLPKQAEIKNIIDHFKNRHSESKIITINFRESLIGCEMIDNNGISIIPHNNCKTVQELEKVVKQLESLIFIDRLYTASILYRIVNRMKKNQIDVPDLETHFANIENLSQNKIQKLAIDMLKKVINTKNDKLVEEVCMPLNKNYDKFNIEKIFTSEAHKFIGSTLVTVQDPISFALKNSEELLENCEPAYKIIKKYNSDVSAYNTEIGKLSFINDPIEKLKKEQELEQMLRPSLKIPKNIMINSLQHLSQYSPKKNIDMESIREPLLLEDLPLNLNIADWMYQLLFAGVGIYTTNKSISKDYIDLILSLASVGKLAFLIADDSICYGANYPLSNVIITDQVADEHSISTIFQLAGRAGRVGTSWIAYCYTEPNTSNRIMEYIKGNENTGITQEAFNLSNSFDKLLFESNSIVEDEIVDDTTSQNIKITFNKNKLSKLQQKINKINSPVSISKQPVIETNDWTTVDNKRTNRNGYIPPHLRDQHMNNDRIQKPRYDNDVRHTIKQDEPKQPLRSSYIPPHLRNKTNSASSTSSSNQSSNNANNRWR